MSDPASVPDRIEKQVLLKAPLARAWLAVSDASQFGAWFGAEFDGPFASGTRVEARIVPTTVDPKVAAAQKPHEGTTFAIDVQRVEPMSLFSFRWHPYGVEKGVDYEREPTTLVEFVLVDVPGGTLLTITESGFGRVPPERRANAFAANEQGWEAQTRLVAKYLKGE